MNSEIRDELKSLGFRENSYGGFEGRLAGSYFAIEDHPWSSQTVIYGDKLSNRHVYQTEITIDRKYISIDRIVEALLIFIDNKIFIDKEDLKITNISEGDIKLEILNDLLSKEMISTSIKLGLLNTLTSIMDHGLDPNFMLNNDCSILEFACKSTNIFHKHRVVKVLLDYGANPNIVDDRGMTLLMKYGKDTEIAKLLLNYGANPNYTCKLTGDTALGINFKEHKLVRLLLEYGAEPNIENYDELSPIDLAIVNKDFVSAEILYRSGAKVKADQEQLEFANLMKKKVTMEAKKVQLSVREYLLFSMLKESGQVFLSKMGMKSLARLIEEHSCNG
ncbi:hypothetical protein GJ688_19550 [Heliobacillus mobilis]|uniref:Ankyrin repeat-containing protein n=1 Tax=Heliobacterium mobile TaxID=28064 RepID=A0A6I3SRT1_HELMO|nr:ankyrin repeat domain-containing protein [Heliobacterium mobile]MTV51072.1 hypothetical protein [Heliobacterium mobile]